MNYIIYYVDRIRLEIKRLTDSKKLKKNAIYELAGVSRPYLDGIINGTSDIDIRILLAINELLEEKINWFDLKDEGIRYSLKTDEDLKTEESNLIDMTKTENELLRALQMITSRLERIEGEVKDIKQTGSN